MRRPGDSAHATTPLNVGQRRVTRAIDRGSIVVDWIASTLAVAALGVALWHYSATRAAGEGGVVPVEKLHTSLNGAHLKGATSARVVLIEYSDFQCPFCGRFAREILPQLESTYIAPGRVLLAFKHLPLAIHDHALRAAVAAECAGEQGRFWEMHDKLFADQSHQDEGSLSRDGLEVGLNLNAFSACLAGPMVAAVSDGTETARSFSLSATPSFLLGRRSGSDVTVTAKVSGARPFDIFARAIDQLLAEQH